MCEVKALSYAIKDELLKGNLHNFGKLLDYGWESKKRMSSKISNPQIDTLYEEAKRPELWEESCWEQAAAGSFWFIALIM